MKSLKIPAAEWSGSMLDREFFEAAMKEKGVKAPIDTVNWPEYPFCPEVTFYAARDNEYLYILFEVSGPDLRAEAMEDNGRVWEDSCCEFFVSDPSDGTYYNFEMNCIGTLLVAKRTGRADARHLSPSDLGRIIRHHSLPRRQYECEGGNFVWSVGLMIPFDLIGAGGSLPECLRANFYKCGDKTAHPHFLSWNPVDAPSPDFHRPESFGKLYL